MTTTLLRALEMTLAFAFLGCQAAPPPESRASHTAPIIGGATTTTAAWPGLAHLSFGGVVGGCGGTLVGEAWVLTAAHCILEESGQFVGPDAVALGRDVTSSTAGDIVPVVQIIRHAQYNAETLDFDVALLRLAQPARRAGARIITAAEWDRVGVAGRPVTVVGWGNTSEGGSPSDIVKAVRLAIVDRTECRERYAIEGFTNVTDRMLCVGVEEGGQGSCQGDSGGPLFVDVDGTPVQVGIVSWALGCARPGLATAYARVPSFLGWIVEQTNGGVTPGSPPAAPRTTPPKEEDTTGGKSSLAVGTVGDVDEETGREERASEPSVDARKQSSAPGKDEDDDNDRKSTSPARVAAPSAGCSLATRRPEQGPVLLALAAVALCLRARRRPSA